MALHPVILLFLLTNVASIVAFSLMAIQTWFARNTDSKDRDWTFLALCASSVGYGVAALATALAKDTWYAPLRYDAVNFFNFVNFAVYVLALSSYLEVKAKWVRVAIGVAGACATYQLLSLVLTAADPAWSLSAVPTPFTTSNLVLQFLGTETSVSSSQQLVFVVQLFNVVTVSALLLRHLSRSRSGELALTVGVILNLLIQANEISIVALDAAYIVPLLPLCYIFEAFRINQTIQSRAFQRIRGLHHQLASLRREAELSHITAGILHDIRNPVLVVELSVQHIRRSVDKSEASGGGFTRQMDAIQSALEDIHFIARHYLDLFRGTMTPKRSNVAIDQLIDHAIALAKPRIQQAGLVKVEIDAETTVVSIAREPISLCLMNLVANAADAVADVDEKWISLEARREGSELTISITDSGAGVPADLRDQIFAQGFTTKTESHGTGLGLSLVREIMDQVGGEVSLDEASAHTRFCLRIPLGELRPAEARPTADVPPQPARRSA